MRRCVKEGEKEEKGSFCGPSSPLNAPQGDGTGPVAVRLLDAAGGRGRLAGGLGGEHLAGGLAARGLASRLLGAGCCVFESI